VIANYAEYGAIHDPERLPCFSRSVSPNSTSLAQGR
jgi:hypothetical protein